MNGVKKCSARRSWQREVLRSMLLLGFPLWLSGCSLYLLKAGYGQARILWKRTPIRELLQDPTVEPEVKQKLELVLDARHFARNHLHLDVSESFTDYVELDRPALAWVVSASEQFEIKPKQWWFPVVGKVPYLGFFSPDEADAEAAMLRVEGWDVQINEAAAYSSLGWFDDPILSTQMKYSPYYLVSLVIHESAHNTIWFPGNVAFNESFASFVGDRGALQYFEQRYGAGSREVEEFRQRLEGEQRLNLLYRQYGQKLSRLYRSMLTPDRMALRKRELLSEFTGEMVQLRQAMPYYPARPTIDHGYNNASFLTYQLYNAGESFFAAQFNASGGDWIAFLERMDALKALSVDELDKTVRTGE